MESGYDPSKRRLLSALSHGSVFLSALLMIPIAIPIVILFVSDDSVVKANAKEAINFHINVWFWGIIVAILVFFLIGYLIVPFFFLYHWGLPLWAIIQCWNKPEETYRYPFMLRLV